MQNKLEHQKINFIWILIFLFLMALSQASLAKLGESAESIKEDQSVLKFEKVSIEKAAIRALEHSGEISKGPPMLPAVAESFQDSSEVQVHFLSKKDGSLREYLNAEGLVFAVTWTGHSHPNLKHLLGSYYADYQSEFKKRGKRTGHGPEVTRTSKILLLKSGHMRSVVGRAICPALVPEGFDLGSLK